MRPIKFRAWDKTKKKMYLFDEIIICSEYNLLWFHLEWEHNYCELDIDEDNYELAQFTWLHDKNWKEIYEGDIVFSEEWNPTTYSVEFERWAFCFWYPWCYQLTNCKYLEKFEVIWNIYENLELLTKNLWA